MKRAIIIAAVVVFFFLTEPRFSRKHPRYGQPHWHTHDLCFQYAIPKTVATTSTDRHAKYAAEIDSMLPPGWTHTHYDNAAAESFIMSNCPAVIDAFRCIRPGAYKADIFRVCWLYAHGGFYIDNDRIPLYPFDTLIDKSQGTCAAAVIAVRGNPHTVVRWFWYNERVDLNVAIAAPGQSFFKCIINSIILNNLQHSYKLDPTHVTGPTLAGECFARYAHNISIPWYTEQDTIQFYGSDDLAFTGDHVSETSKFHYGKLWEQRKVYTCESNIP